MAIFNIEILGGLLLILVLSRLYPHTGILYWPFRKLLVYLPPSRRNLAKWRKTQSQNITNKKTNNNKKNKSNKQSDVSVPVSASKIDMHFKDFPMLLFWNEIVMIMFFMIILIVAYSWSEFYSWLIMNHSPSGWAELVFFGITLFTLYRLLEYVGPKLGERDSGVVIGCSIIGLIASLFLIAMPIPNLLLIEPDLALRLLLTRMNVYLTWIGNTLNDENNGNYEYNYNNDLFLEGPYFGELSLVCLRTMLALLCASITAALVIPCLRFGKLLNEMLVNYKGGVWKRILLYIDLLLPLIFVITFFKPIMVDFNATFDFTNSIQGNNQILESFNQCNINLNHTNIDYNECNRISLDQNEKSIEYFNKLDELFYNNSNLFIVQTIILILFLITRIILHFHFIQAWLERPLTYLLASLNQPNMDIVALQEQFTIHFQSIMIVTLQYISPILLLSSLTLILIRKVIPYLNMSFLLCMLKEYLMGDQQENQNNEILCEQFYPEHYFNVTLNLRTEYNYNTIYNILPVSYIKNPPLVDLSLFQDIIMKTKTFDDNDKMNYVDNIFQSLKQFSSVSFFTPQVYLGVIQFLLYWTLLSWVIMYILAYINAKSYPSSFTLVNQENNTKQIKKKSKKKGKKKKVYA